MPEPQPNQQWERIYVELVPKEVDIADLISDIFRQKKTFMSFSRRKAQNFLGELQARQAEGHEDLGITTVNEHLLPKAQAATFECIGGPYEIKLGFKPDYQLLWEPERKARKAKRRSKEPAVITPHKQNTITLPTFDLFFRPFTYHGTRDILETALDQFYIRQEDIEEGTLRVCALQGKKRVQEDLEVLAQYLPKGTTINARCDWGLANGRASYRIG